MRFMPYQCEEHSYQVHVRYTGLHNNAHCFRVSSLSRPGLEHYVKVQLSHKFVITRDLDPQQILESGFVKVDSSDEFYRYCGPSYYNTVAGTAIRPEFRRPKDPEHQYRCSHTLFAVLDLLCYLQPGTLRENYSAICSWDEDRNRYEIVPYVE